MAERISVVICTRNRAERLGRVLDSLAGQRPGRCGKEIVVVDNGSSDHTRAMALNRNRPEQMPVVYLYEPRDGVSHARNRGVRAAGGDIVAFIDDDAVAHPGWLGALACAFDRPERPAVVVGPIHPLPPFALPAWFPPRLKTHLSLVDRGPKARRLRYPRYGFGTNMAFHRRRLPVQAASKHRAAAMGSTGELHPDAWFDPVMGRCARHPLRTGEETDLMLRVERHGGSILYAPDAQVFHELHGERLRPGWLVRQAWWVGAAMARMEARSGLNGLILRRLPLALSLPPAALCGAALAAAAGNRRGAILAWCIASHYLGHLGGLAPALGRNRKSRQPGRQ